MLAEDSQHCVQIRRVLDTLGITRYKFNKLVEALRDDLSEIGYVDCRFLVEDSILVCERADYSIYQQLRLYYMKQSSRYQIFEYEYVDSKGESRQKFLADHYMSQTKFYALRAQVEAILNEQTIVKVKPQGVTLHPELVERIKITNVYYHFYNGIEDPFPELKNSASRFCNFLTMTFGISLTPSQRLKLQIFFQIQIKRLAGRHFMNLRQLVKLTRDGRIPF